MRALLVSLPEIVVQVKRCVAFVHRKHPASKIFVCGHSAGGHLTAMMLYVDWATEFGIQVPFLGGEISSFRFAKRSISRI